MPGLLLDSVAVVTGGSSGLGKMICQRFAEEGAKAIIVADISEKPREGGDHVSALVTTHGAEFKFVKTDVTQKNQIENAVQAADDFGGITVLVTSAGIIKLQDFLDITEEDYDVVMDVNTKGSFLSAQIAARSMIEGGREGSIILLSSFGGILGSGLGVSYCMSKGAVKLMAYAIAHALGPKGIRVNAVHPGFIDTAMNAGVSLEGLGWQPPLGRPGTATEVANLAVFLASPLASYITGASYLVDGGITNTT